MTKIVFWRISASPHIDPLYPEIANLLGFQNIKVVFLSKVRDERRRFGWSEDEIDTRYSILEPSDSEINDIIRKESESIHIFSGVLYHGIMRRIYYKILRNGGEVVLLSEGRDFCGIKGVVRYFQGLAIEGRFRKRIRYVLAIGNLAARNYIRLGFSKEKIFKYCYVIGSSFSSSQPRTIQKECDKVNFCVVGRLIPLKRLDLILMALNTINSTKWNLTIVGDGPERANLESLCKQFNFLGDRVKFAGLLPNAQVMEYLINSDYMIFASNKDGWGAVVNESLAVGTPVVCSDYPGASCLINDGENGFLFEVDNENSLSNALRKCVEKGVTSEPERREISLNSRKISPSSMAFYLIQAVQGEHPKPPWE